MLEQLCEICIVDSEDFRKIKSKEYNLVGTSGQACIVDFMIENQLKKCNIDYAQFFLQFNRDNDLVQEFPVRKDYNLSEASNIAKQNYDDKLKEKNLITFAIRKLPEINRREFNNLQKRSGLTPADFFVKLLREYQEGL